MGAFEAIIVLALVGFLLIAAEVFVPGMVLGILGGFCLMGAVGVAYGNYGALTGTLVFAGLAILTMTGVIIWIFSFPQTALGRRIMLRQSLEPGEGAAVPRASLLDEEGSALTPLRPSGTARFGDRKVDVVAESDFIEAGDAIVVVREEGIRVVVRKKAP